MSRVLIIGCGALAAEITALKKANHWSGVDVQCLDAALHNRPERIAEQLEQALDKRYSDYKKLSLPMLTVAQVVVSIASRNGLVLSDCQGLIAMNSSQPARYFESSPTPSPERFISPIFSHVISSA